MPRKYRLVAASCLPTACLALGVTLAFAEPATTDTVTAAPAAAAGQWIHVDPQSGARTARPSTAAAAASAGNPALSTSGQGLVEAPAPGGGMTIDLQGRFRSAAVATVGPDGKVTVDCIEPGIPAERSDR